jgi:ribosomal 30S subunit maturation factor RimM
MFKEIGYLKKSFGVEGFIRYNLFHPYEVDMLRKQFIFLDMDGSMVPFLVKDLNEEKSTLRLEWINSLEAANKFAGHTIFLSSKDHNFKEQVENQLTLIKMFNTEGEQIGIVKEFKEFPGQKMMILELNNQEHLIPFHEDLIIEQSDDKIIYNLPEGLLDL